MPKLLNVIVACAENRAIGRGGRPLWHIPEDSAFFHTRTAGQTVVLGRICFQTWPGAVRDGRVPIVVTRQSSLATPGVRTAASLADALGCAEALPGEIFVCGGQRLYEETLLLPRPLRLYLTLVHAEPPGDRFFPEWRGQGWRETARRDSADPSYRYTFLTFERAGPPPARPGA